MTCIKHVCWLIQLADRNRPTIAVSHQQIGQVVRCFTLTLKPYRYFCYCLSIPTTDTDSMMIRLIDEVHHQVLGSTFTRPKVKDSGDLSRQLETCLNQVGEGHQDTLLVLLVDGLNKLDSTTKTKKVNQEMLFAFKARF